MLIGRGILRACRVLKLHDEMIFSGLGILRAGLVLKQHRRPLLEGQGGHRRAETLVEGQGGHRRTEIQLGREPLMQQPTTVQTVTG